MFELIFGMLPLFSKQVLRKKFSATVPINGIEVDVSLCFNGSGLVTNGRMTKGLDKNLRITTGWIEFVRRHCITVGMTCVLRVGLSNHRWQLSVVQV
jgi:hypothetical protein